MDRYVERVTTEVKKYDRDLFAERSPNGAVQIYRKSVRWEAFSLGSDRLIVSVPCNQLVVPLTDTFNFKGKPVEWGLEPISWKIRQMDAHRDDSYYEKMVENRERIAKDEKRIKENEMRAIAADMRSDFAKATNNINTASLSKVDPRSKQDGKRQ